MASSLGPVTCERRRHLGKGLSTLQSGLTAGTPARPRQPTLGPPTGSKPHCRVLRWAQAGHRSHSASSAVGETLAGKRLWLMGCLCSYGAHGLFPLLTALNSPSPKALEELCMARRRLGICCSMGTGTQTRGGWAVRLISDSSQIIGSQMGRGGYLRLTQH